VADLARSVDPQVEREGLLLPAGNAIFGMQVERLMREWANPNRRAFQSLVDLADWLDEALKPRERARLTAFLHSARRQLAAS
jgi:hypothetical protein